ncbi:soluble scavenger receptor cysteine-rich domain-containing protein SSC5D-like [Dendrobium catenatum]|uniref:soluble scavenger receptor cysteine-rich domain-containing protein SSC5D-like n=1 Tax=Dendrobium catenatum TaxID=906689 RepID=UPI0009F1DBF1|nr:soluble scavenger receptor cysteine-rich domain-containing protein SSC5D-like [Dendrobium catenatum]
MPKQRLPTPPSNPEPFPVIFYPPKPKLSFRADDLSEGASLWNFSMVGYSLGQRPYYERLLSAMRKVWPLKGAISLLSLADGFFLIKFSSKEDYDAVWSGGPWFLLGKPFILQQWSPKFKPKRDENASIPIWIKIVDFPLALWTPTGISKIASYIGIPLTVDSLTAKRSRLTFARVCVLISKDSPLPDEIPLDIDDEDLILKVLYDWKPTPCEGCRSLVHSYSICPKNPNPSPPVVLPPPRPRGRSSSRPPRPNSRPNSKPPPNPALNLPPQPTTPLLNNPVQTSTPGDVAVVEVPNQIDNQPSFVASTNPSSIYIPTVNNNSPNLHKPEKTTFISNLNSPNDDASLEASSSSTPPFIPNILIGSSSLNLSTSNKFKALLEDDPPLDEDPLLNAESIPPINEKPIQNIPSPSTSSTKSPNQPPPKSNTQSSPLSKHTRGKSTKKGKPSKPKS